MRTTCFPTISHCIPYLGRGGEYPRTYPPTPLTYSPFWTTHSHPTCPPPWTYPHPWTYSSTLKHIYPTSEHTQQPRKGHSTRETSCRWTGQTNTRETITCPQFCWLAVISLPKHQFGLYYIRICHKIWRKTFLTFLGIIHWNVFLHFLSMRLFKWTKIPVNWDSRIFLSALKNSLGDNEVS